jgi:hypothetical protein
MTAFPVDDPGAWSDRWASQPDPETQLMTIAERYNTEAARLLPEMADRLAVDPAITRANDIDEIVFHRSEYLGGMACAILAMLERQDGDTA